MTEEQSARYQAATHAMQTGVEYYKHVNGAGCEPKHLRVGVNSAMVETSAIAKLLIDKGVITAEEHAEALIAGMEAEAASYEKLLADHYGAKVTLA